MKLKKLRKRRNFVFWSGRQIEDMLIELGYPRIKLPNSRLDTMHNWCNEMVGENNWVHSGNYVYFSNESDLAMFMLRWSE